MTPVQQTAVIAAAVSVTLISIYRRRIFAVTGTGAFFVSSICLVYVGVLVAPWAIDAELPRALPYIRWDEIRERDLRNAIWLVGGGLGLTLAGNIVAATVHSMMGDWRPTRWPAILLSPPRGQLGTSFDRLIVVSAFSLFLAVLLFVPKASVAVTGLVGGYLHLDATAQYEARFEMQQTGLLYYSLVYNVLPFLAVLSWTGYRVTRRAGMGILAMVMIPSTAFFLLVTFEKMSLVLFLILLLAANALVSRRSHSRGRTVRRFSARQAIAIGGIASAVAVMLFYLQYAGLASALSGEVSAPMTDIVRITGTNLISRQSIQPIMYLRFFPDVDPHYGLSNIGMLMSLLGTPFYSDTIAVLRFFSVYDFGSTSVGALGDFYGAFGWGGLAVGSLLLGAALYWIDSWLSERPPSALMVTVSIFWLAVAYYLSQAAVARCISTYGGASFFLLYMILSTPAPPIADVLMDQAKPAR
ncbi:MAG: putative rane protein [Gemmatimonadales bacterium]|nr:putative rane protein [Gemmatimonadales bacterium]